jgi:hypothetical protein
MHSSLSSLPSPYRHKYKRGVRSYLAVLLIAEEFALVLVTCALPQHSFALYWYWLFTQNNLMQTLLLSEINIQHMCCCRVVPSGLCLIAQFHLSIVHHASVALQNKCQTTMVFIPSRQTAKLPHCLPWLVFGCGTYAQDSHSHAHTNTRPRIFDH